MSIKASAEAMQKLAEISARGGITLESPFCTTQKQAWRTARFLLSEETPDYNKPQGPKYRITKGPSEMGEKIFAGVVIFLIIVAFSFAIWGAVNLRKGFIQSLPAEQQSDAAGW